MFSKPPIEFKPQADPTFSELDKKTKSGEESEKTALASKNMFPIHLKPGAEKSVISVVKSYTPNVKNGFYDELKLAINGDIKFACFIIDAMLDETPFIENCIQLIRFCKKNNIPVMNFQHEPDAKAGLSTHPLLISELGQNTTTIIKPTFSIFSADLTHEHLRTLSPDALIIVGGEADLCIIASTIGNHKEVYATEDYGEEFGATEYGYPVYIQEGLVYPDNVEKILDSFKHELLFRFCAE